MTACNLLVIGAGSAAIVLTTTLRNLSDSGQRSWQVILVLVAVVASVPALVAGVSLLAGAGGGLYWLLAQFVAGIVIAVYYGWVLLIEIRR